MAEKHDSVEKIVTIPLRKGLQKAARDNRTKRAVYEIRQYVFRHTKADDVKVSKLVNELLWKRGIQKPPAKIKVKLIVSKGAAKVMMPDEIEEKKEEKKGAASSIRDKIMGGGRKPEIAAKEPAASVSKESPAAEAALAKEEQKPEKKK